jgi:hypothetical protein
MSGIRRRRWQMVVVAGLLVSGCGGVAEPTTTEIAAVTADSTTTTGPPARASSAPAASKATTTTTATTTEPPPRFEALVQEIDADIEVRMARSWRVGCPVPLGDLRLLELTYYDFEGEVQLGELVVHQDQVDAMLSVFERLFDIEYPIEQMRLVDEFDADDMLSMQANNTSAFNCRVVSGTNRWSQHAYGRAIDVNPLINPWVRGERVSPPEGAIYVDRSQDAPGLIRGGDEVVAAFAAVGWSWGGDWAASKDYQHFSANGQ